MEKIILREGLKLREKRIATYAGVKTLMVLKARY